MQAALSMVFRDCVSPTDRRCLGTRRSIEPRKKAFGFDIASGITTYGPGKRKTTTRHREYFEGKNAGAGGIHRSGSRAFDRYFRSDLRTLWKTTQGVDRTRRAAREQFLLLRGMRGGIASLITGCAIHSVSSFAISRNGVPPFSTGFTRLLMISKDLELRTPDVFIQNPC